MDNDNNMYSRMHLIAFTRNGDWDQKIKHGWYGENEPEIKESCKVYRLPDLQGL